MNNLKIQTKKKTLCPRRLLNDGKNINETITQTNCVETPEITEEPTLFSPTVLDPSTSSCTMLNTSETIEMNDPSSSSDEEDWNTDNFVNDSIDSESFSSRSE
uniref:Uncharacterized protein n=1 Tax=Schizaphis graminum TaxID=13262 RepID=A0A2S2NT44_SCHGA